MRTLILSCSLFVFISLSLLTAALLPKWLFATNVLTTHDANALSGVELTVTYQVRAVTPCVSEDSELAKEETYVLPDHKTCLVKNAVED